MALNFRPTDEVPLTYVDELNHRAAVALASPAGYHSWLAAGGRPQVTGPTHLYAAIAGFGTMRADPDMRGMDMRFSTTGGWIPDGTMTPVSEPLAP
ncbi:MAG: hypothetical protein GEU74_10035 [Nitriliruptorales bacterium]|nr:hypothetical protein [Nitriliruptorales bacterium]